MGSDGSVACIIPARYGSTRLPGKPLVEINGLPLVMWVYSCAREAQVFDRIIVATDDERIALAVERHGGEAMMTAAHHRSGTDRVFEAARKISCGYIVNLQGDEPCLPSPLLGKFCTAVRGLDDFTLLTVVSHATIKGIENPNVVKAVLDADGGALYFSRSPIPYDRDGSGRTAFFRHIGLYGFSRSGLERYCTFPEGTLERLERLEQLRALEFGMRIKCIVHDFESVGIDTPEDLAAFRDRSNA
jgi:3-deoxy-manno-octulosonate cytidylyltransferase (CMP-KDO synthetase)